MLYTERLNIGTSKYFCHFCYDLFAEQTSVTDVVKDRKLDYKGLPDMFVDRGQIKVDGEQLSKASNITDSVDCGKLLEYHIGRYLTEEKEFTFTIQPEGQNFWGAMYGAAAWSLMKPKIINPTAKLLEQPLEGYGANGRADCIIRREGMPTIIIDFKWTAANYQNPSPGYALQLLLYQWMEGKKYEEKEGAELYLIRYCDSINTMQLFQFSPPAFMKYPSVSDYKISVKTNADICEMFEQWYTSGNYKDPEMTEDMSAFIASLKDIKLD